MALADLRREFALGGLRRRDLDTDPVAQFRSWFQQASGQRAGGRLRRVGIALYKCLQAVLGAEPTDVNAMALATADKEGRPSARMVLLKGVDERGFIFYTNYESRKGDELTENPQAALVFYWAEFERQICITGSVKKLPREESEAYFRTRPRGSRLAAWASRQSAVVGSRPELEQNWEAAEAKYAGADVPLPPYWGGYVLSPSRMEFWQGRVNRLHDRFCYTRQPDGRWLIERLAP